MEEESFRFLAAAAAFEAHHREDPSRIRQGDREVPWSVHYHERLSHWVCRLSPRPSEALRLAARAQHIHRWKIPRSGYPEGRAGYRRWRTDLAVFHADLAGRILADAGYGPEMIERVAVLLRKSGLGRDREVQLFEDAICLVFLENEFARFSEKHDAAKLTSILQKTWRKMSRTGQEAAMAVAENLPAGLRSLVAAAVSGLGKSS